MSNYLRSKVERSPGPAKAAGALTAFYSFLEQCSKLCIYSEVPTIHVMSRTVFWGKLVLGCHLNPILKTVKANILSAEQFTTQNCELVNCGQILKSMTVEC